MLLGFYVLFYYYYSKFSVASGANSITGVGRAPSLTIECTLENITLGTFRRLGWRPQGSGLGPDNTCLGCGSSSLRTDLFLHSWEWEARGHPHVLQLAPQPLLGLCPLGVPQAGKWGPSPLTDSHALPGYGEQSTAPSSKGTSDL